MKRTILTGVVVVAILLVAIWSFVHFGGLQTSLLWTGLVGAAAWAVRSSVEQKREYQRLLAEKKRNQYLEFLDIMNRYFGAPQKLDPQPTGASAQPTHGEVSPEDFRKWILHLTLIGSDDVVRAWNATRLQALTEQGREGGVTVMRGWGRLLLAMRKDCGHPDTQLKVTDILVSFVNDIEQHRSILDPD